MKTLLLLFAIVGFLLVSQWAYAQEVYSEMPIIAEGGVLKCKRVVIAFNRNVIPTTAGTRIVDTARFPIQDVAVKTLLRQLSAHYGVPTIRKTIPRLIWGDTLVVNRRTGFISRVQDMSQNFAVDFPVPVPLDSVLTIFRELPCVRYAEQPISVHPLITPNDPLFGSQWYLNTIKAPQAWNITTGIAATRIAIIDIAGTFVVSNHIDFQLSGGGNKFVGGDGSLGGRHPFGVAGVAAATTNNGTGIAGLGWNVSLLGYYFNDLDNDSTQIRLPRLIDLAITDGADVINCSFGALKQECNPSKHCPYDYQEVRDAIARAIAAGVVVVAAAGNSEADLPGCLNCGGRVPYLEYPAAYDGVMAVSGTTEQDQFVVGYNYSPPENELFVDISAPSQNIWTLDYNNGYNAPSGTSLSSPLVSALAALILSYNPNYSRADVEQFICQTADKVGQYPYNMQGQFGSRNIYMGYGRINAYKALSMANGNPRVPQNFSGNIFYTEYNSHPRISWLRDPSHPQDVDVEQYEIWRRIISNRTPSQNPPWALLTIVGNTPTSYVDYSINYAGGGPYTVRYRIKAVDAAGLKSDFTDSVGVNFGNAYKPAVENKGTLIVFQLAQNYPNPFNPQTTVTYTIPDDGFVSLKLFDMLGREVKTVVNEFTEIGKYSVEVDAGNLSSGVYHYRLQHNGKALAKSMIVLK